MGPFSSWLWADSVFQGRRSGVGGAMRKGDLCISFLDSKTGLNAILSKALGFSGENCDTVARNFMF